MRRARRAPRGVEVKRIAKCRGSAGAVASGRVLSVTAITVAAPALL
jgi:hypothetical protein